jgi:vacuolar-type H+-ATPase subunit E/Vma4
MNDYPSQAIQAGLGRIQMQSVRQRLNDKKANLEASLGEVNEALRLLDENPTFEKVQDAIQKAGY